MPQSQQRILLKVSGSYLTDPTTASAETFNPKRLTTFASYVHELVAEGLDVVIVIGGGNILRGTNSLFTTLGIPRAEADAVGLASTLLNGLMLQAVLPNSLIMAPEGWCVASVRPFKRFQALEALAQGKIIICAGGLGIPFFSTDTTAIIRACELRCDLVLKATRVDGIYTEDPLITADCQRYTQISYDDAIGRKLAIMDSTALTLARDNAIPITVFNLWGTHSPAQVLKGSGLMTRVGSFATSHFSTRHP